jgi:hypothetical protein
LIREFTQPKRRTKFMTKRRVVLIQLISVTLIAACKAAKLNPLREQDTTAQSAGFKLRADQVNANQSPGYRTGQICGNCRYARPADAASLACDMFPGRSVPSHAWCEHYEAK